MFRRTRCPRAYRLSQRVNSGCCLVDGDAVMRHRDVGRQEIANHDSRVLLAHAVQERVVPEVRVRIAKLQCASRQSVRAASGSGTAPGTSRARIFSDEELP